MFTCVVLHNAYSEDASECCFRGSQVGSFVEENLALLPKGSAGIQSTPTVMTNKRGNGRDNLKNSAEGQTRLGFSFYVIYIY